MKPTENLVYGSYIYKYNRRALTNTALAARTNTQTYCNKYTKHITPQIRILPYTILSWSLVRHVQILVIHMYKYTKHVKPWIGFLPNTLSPCPWVSCMYKYLRRYTLHMSDSSTKSFKIKSPVCTLPATHISSIFAISPPYSKSALIDHHPLLTLRRTSLILTQSLLTS